MSLLIRTRDLKISYGFGVTVTYACSVGFVYCAIRIIQSRPFLISLRNFFFYMLPHFHQNLSHHFIIEQIIHHVGVLNLPNQISLKSIFNPGQD